MQFLITAYDGKDEEAPARRQKARPSHLENIRRVKGSVICGGGVTNEEGKAVGSFLVMDFASRELLEEYLESEPYIRQKVWQEVKVEPCNVVVQNNEMVGK